MKRVRSRAWALVVGITVIGAAGFLVGKRGLPFVGRITEWSIAIYAGPGPLEVVPTGEPVLRAADVTDAPAEFVADPFLIRAGERWYMFFEVMNEASGHGDIAVATSSDARDWSYERIVLDEPFHLSYPYVFDWEGEVYMVPETSGANEVRLYRATSFPTGWQRVAKLVDGFHMDPSIFRHRDRWWLYTVSSPNNDFLRLYHADVLTGPWTEHPASPVVTADATVARPGGRVVSADGRLLRFAQDDADHYGARVTAFEVVTLTTTEYAERRLDWSSLGPAGDGWNAGGMHHIDLHRLPDGSWIASVDGWRRGFRIGMSY